MSASLIAMGLTGTAVAGYAAAVAFTKIQLKKDPTSGQLDAYVPFTGVHSGGEYFRLPKGVLVRLFRVHGATEATLAPEEQEAYGRRRANAIAHLLNAGCTLRLHAIREPATHHEYALFPSPFLNRVHEAWTKGFATIFDTRRYLAIESPRGMPEWQFRDVCTQAITRLSDFKPQALTKGALLSFYGDRMDPLFGGISAPAGLNALCSSLAPSHIEASRVTGVVTVRHGTQELCAQQITVDEWVEKDSSDIIDGLLELPLRLEVTFVLRPMSRATVLMWLERNRKEQNADRENDIINDELRQVANELQAGRDTTCKAQLSITVIGQRDELPDAVGQVYGHLSSQGMKPVIEGKAAAYLWLARLPGHPMLVRARPLRTSNIGRLWRWDRHPEGFDSSDWGDGPIRMFRTIGGAPYRFQWHISPATQEVGHTLVVAPTRGGKTTTLLHMVGGSMRHPTLRTYIIDRNLSTRVWGEAAGAAYLNPADTTQVSLNPFQGPNTREERDFAASFIRQLAGITEDDPAVNNAISDAVHDIYKLPAEQRILSRLWKSAFRPGALKDALRRWADPADVGGLINASQDSLSLHSRRLVIFDYTQLFQEPAQAAAVTAYLMHRIRQLSVQEASPHLVYAEEVAPMLTDPVFGPSIQVILREHAKLRGVCVLVFQDLGAAFRGPIGETILTNARRQIIFPNPTARAEDYNMLALSSDEWSFIKGQHPANDRMQRPILIRSEHESVIVDADLSDLGPLLDFYRGGSEPVLRMKKAQKEWGSKWQDHFAKG